MPTNINNPQSPRRLLSAQRRTKAYEMRIEGKSYAEIGKALGISPAAVYQGLEKHLEELAQQTNEKAEEVRRLELDRLDKMFNALWPRAQSGNVEAIDAVITKIMKRRAALMGLDKTQAQVHTVFPITPEIARNLTDEQLNRLLAGEGMLNVLVAANRTQPEGPGDIDLGGGAAEAGEAETGSTEDENTTG